MKLKKKLKKVKEKRKREKQIRKEKSLKMKIKVLVSVDKEDLEIKKIIIERLYKYGPVNISGQGIFIKDKKYEVDKFFNIKYNKAVSEFGRKVIEDKLLKILYEKAIIYIFDKSVDEETKEKTKEKKYLEWASETFIYEGINLTWFDFWEIMKNFREVKFEVYINNYF